MRDASTEFLASLTDFHHVVERVDVVFADGHMGPSFDVESGDYQISADAEIRHNAGLQLVPGDVTPAVLRDALSQPGTIARYSRGIKLADGTDELKRVVTGEIAVGEIGISRDGIELIPITVFDSFTRFQWPSTGAFALPVGMNYVTAIVQTAIRFAPRTEWGEVMSTSYTTPALLFATETSISQVLLDMAKAFGAELFFDNTNKLNLKPIPITSGRATNWVFDLDDENSRVTKASVRTNYDQMPNGFIVIGSHSSGANVIGEAWDMNPTSKTYRYGTYGERAMIKRTEKAITIPQATAMARGLLEKTLGGSFEVILEIIPNMLIDVGDLVHVMSTKLNLNDKFVVDAIAGSTGRTNINQPMRLTMRRGVVLADLEPI